MSKTFAESFLSNGQAKACRTGETSNVAIRLPGAFECPEKGTKAGVAADAIQANIVSPGSQAALSDACIAIGGCRMIVWRFVTEFMKRISP